MNCFDNILYYKDNKFCFKYILKKNLINFLLFYSENFYKNLKEIK